jgi:pyridoxine 5-phosphate synthase
MTRLSVNIDHVATLRQARRATYPDPLEAAHRALSAGAHGITAHLRADRRHIQDQDVARLRAELPVKLNLEISLEPEMIAVALHHRPQQVTLVPERPEEVTTEGGLDLLLHGRRVREVAETLADAGIGVSVFVDPTEPQIEWLAGLVGPVAGFEINTDAYSRGSAAAELAKIQAGATRGRALGLAVYAGHGLTTGNVGPVAAVAEIEELNIGHGLVARAVMVGMATAVEEFLAAMAGG